FYQDDYGIKLEVLHIVSYNHSYGHDVKAGLVWYNRTTRAANASGYLTKDLGTDITVINYKFLSNEFRPTGISATVNLCKEAIVDRFGVAKSLRDRVDFPLRCPVKKGFLKLSYGTVDYSKLPPHFQNGRYRNHVKFHDGPNFLGEFYLDVEIIEKIKKWELPRILN
ncbi:hypothetical protein ILUMI_18103, partial [Ignelater luminosus]